MFPVTDAGGTHFMGPDDGRMADHQNSMNMIGHDNEFIDHNMRKMIWDF